MHAPLKSGRLLRGAVVFAVLMACTTACRGPGFTNASPQTLLACDYDALEKNSRREGPAIIAQAYGSVSAIPLGAVVVSDGWTFKQVIAQTISSEVTDGATVKVVARFANCSGYPLALQVRTHFLRDGGSPAEPVSAWSPLNISTGLTGVYEETSFKRTDVVRGYYIEVAPL